jgi:hypothetical protein
MHIVDSYPLVLNLIREEISDAKMSIEVFVVTVASERNKNEILSRNVSILITRRKNLRMTGVLTP